MVCDNLLSFSLRAYWSDSCRLVVDLQFQNSHAVWYQSTALMGNYPNVQHSPATNEESILFWYERFFTALNAIKFCSPMVYVLVVSSCWVVLSSTFISFLVSTFWNIVISERCMDKPAFWCSNEALEITIGIIILLISLPLFEATTDTDEAED